ncbi:MAG: dihydrodipicolinate synthase family protein, partial [Clostridia bacterium]|nr:dihydrodipicolinate synthase family protein [Clostridia bacterium]
MAFIPRGIIPPVVTPTNEDGSFNPVMFDKLLNHLIDNGVHGLFPFGTTGEFYAFEDDDYRRIITQAVETVNHRVPVYAGANSITTKGTIRLAKIAKECGADALSVLTPMFISQTQAELYEHYRAIAESTDLPIIIYNNRPKT